MGHEMDWASREGPKHINAAPTAQPIPTTSVIAAAKGSQIGTEQSKSNGIPRLHQRRRRCRRQPRGSRSPRPPRPSLSAPVALRRRSLPTRGPGLSLRCAGADWSEPALVTVAEKLDAAAAARKARAFAGAGGDEEKGRVEAVNGASSVAVEEPVAVAVPFAPLEQSLVAVDIAGDDAVSQALGSKLGFEEISTYVMYGTGAFFAGWILSAVISALDSIPLLPKILEIVGLGYTIWFGTRYLLFKENRDELLVKVEDFKRRIVGSDDE